MIIPSYIHKVTSTVPPRPLGASTCHGRPSCLCRSCGACGVFRACGRQTNKRGRAWKMAWVAGLKRWIFKWWLGGVGKGQALQLVTSKQYSFDFSKKSISKWTSQPWLPNGSSFPFHDGCGIKYAHSMAHRGRAPAPLPCFAPHRVSEAEHAQRDVWSCGRWRKRLVTWKLDMGCQGMKQFRLLVSNMFYVQPYLERIWADHFVVRGVWNTSYVIQRHGIDDPRMPTAFERW